MMGEGRVWGFYVQDTGNAPDGALQADYSHSRTLFGAMKMFEGVSITDIFNAIGISPIPPDPAIAVRPTQVVKMTNGAYQVYNKETGQGLLEAPMALANIWTRGDNCKYVVCTPIPSAVFCWPQSIDFCKKTITHLATALPLDQKIQHVRWQSNCSFWLGAQPLGIDAVCGS
jgi:hypothetical protein